MRVYTGVGHTDSESQHNIVLLGKNSHKCVLCSWRGRGLNPGSLDLGLNALPIVPPFPPRSLVILPCPRLLLLPRSLLFLLLDHSPSYTFQKCPLFFSSRERLFLCVYDPCFPVVQLLDARDSIGHTCSMLPYAHCISYVCIYRYNMWV